MFYYYVLLLWFHWQWKRGGPPCNFEELREFVLWEVYFRSVYLLGNLFPVHRAKAVGLYIVSLFGQEKAAFSLNACYTSSVGREPCYFRATSTWLRRHFLDMRATSVEYFFQWKENFLGHHYIFLFPDQYEHPGFYIASAYKECF